jgi:hypothetical protein
VTPRQRRLHAAVWAVLGPLLLAVLVLLTLDRPSPPAYAGFDGASATGSPP